MATKKREIQYVLDGYVNSRYYKAMQSVQKTIARASQYTKGLNTLQKQSDSIGRRAAIGQGMFGGGLLRTAAGAAAAYISIFGLVAGYKAVTSAANAQIRADTRLQQIMSNVKGTTHAQVIELQRQAVALQKITTVGDDVTGYAQSQLASFQLQAKTISALTPSWQDLAVAQYGVNVTQEDTFKSANLLGKVFTGQVGALRRVGISFTKAQEKIMKAGNESQKTAMLIKVIQENYGGLARKMAQTPEGRIVRLKNAWDDIQETIGMKVLPIQEKLVKYLSDHLPEIQRLITRVISQVERWGNELKPVYDRSVKTGSWIIRNWGKIEPIVVGITGAYVALRTAILLTAAAQAVLNLAMDLNPVLLIIQLVGAELFLVIRYWKEINAWVQKHKVLASILLPVLFPLVGAIVVMVSRWKEVCEQAHTFYTWLVRIYEIWKNFTPAGWAFTGGQKIAKSIGKRAEGGPISAGRPYVVGERGPELIWPRKRGFVQPSMALAGAGGITVNMTVNVPGGSRHEVDAGIRTGTDYLVQKLDRLRRDKERRAFRDPE